jgi:hypothetical protein
MVARRNCICAQVNQQMPTTKTWIYTKDILSYLSIIERRLKGKIGKDCRKTDSLQPLRGKNL